MNVNGVLLEEQRNRLSEVADGDELLTGLLELVHSIQDRLDNGDRVVKLDFNPEYKDYRVEFNIPVTTTVTFDTARNPGVTWDSVTVDDAIANAYGSLPYGLQELLEGEGFAMLAPSGGRATPIP